jgi:hypothetical protein
VRQLQIVQSFGSGQEGAVIINTLEIGLDVQNNPQQLIKDYADYADSNTLMPRRMMLTSLAKASHAGYDCGLRVDPRRNGRCQRNIHHAFSQFAGSAAPHRVQSCPAIQRLAAVSPEVYLD